MPDAIIKLLTEIQKDITDIKFKVRNIEIDQMSVKETIRDVILEEFNSISLNISSNAIEELQSSIKSIEYTVDSIDSATGDIDCGFSNIDTEVATMQETLTEIIGLIKNPPKKKRKTTK